MWPAAVASSAETVLVSLPTPWIVRAVALGKDGIIEGSRVKTFVDLSTTGPRVAIEVARSLAAKGIVSVDAPVSGGVTGAEKGTLAIMVSGPAQLFASLEPMLRVMGKVFLVGDPRHGADDEAGDNLMSATALAITSGRW